MTPEASARLSIHAQLLQCGWGLQDYLALNLSAARRIAVREVSLDSGRCDYLLLVGRKPVGVIEGKKEGTTLSTVSDQSRFLGENLPAFLKTAETLPVFYESTSVETLFRDECDLHPLSGELP